MRVALVAVIVALPLALGAPALGASEGTIALQVCGRLVQHRASTATAPGSVTVGTRTFAVAAATPAGNGGVEVAVGRDLCFVGAQGRTSGALLRYLFFSAPVGPVCGTVLANRGDQVHLRAEFGLLFVIRDGPAEPRPGERLCYVTATSSAGDLVATRTDPVDTTLEREWVWHCGTVKLYRPATATADGTITVGSETFPIARGTAYTGDPAGDRTDRTTVGQNMCVRGVRDGSGFIEYLTTPMHLTTGGTVYEYVPPSAAGPGIATLTFRSQLRMRVPAAIDAQVDVVRGAHCYAVGVDAGGDMAATAVVPCAEGRAGGGDAGASPSATLAPSAPPSPTASAPAVTAAVAQASPSPSAARTPPPEPRASADWQPDALTLMLIAAAVIGAVALLVYAQARQRGR